MAAGRSCRATDGNPGALLVTPTRWTGACPSRSCLDSPLPSLQVQSLQDMENVCLTVSQSSRGPHGPCAQLPPHQPATRGRLAPALLRSTLPLWTRPGRPPGPGREYEAFHLPRRLLPPRPSPALAVLGTSLLFPSLSLDCLPDSTDGQVI